MTITELLAAITEDFTQGRTAQFKVNDTVAVEAYGHILHNMGFAVKYYGSTVVVTPRSNPGRWRIHTGVYKPK